MNTDLFEIKEIADKSHKNLLAGAIEIAIRDAEIHGTTLVIKTNGKIEELTPKQMRARLKKTARKTKKT